MGQKKKAEGSARVGTSLRGLLKGVALPPAEPSAAEREAAGRGAAKLPRERPATRTDERPPRARAAKAARPAHDERPSESLRGDDRIKFNDAMAGVRPLDRNKPVRAPRTAMGPPSKSIPADVASSDDEARARLAMLVAGGVRFEIERRDEEIQGRRAGSPPSQPRALSARGVVPEATCDLHGLRAKEAEREVVRFVRALHRRGAKRVCIIHGKGLHSEGGLGVLRERVVHVLTEGGAAPVVQAFATAPTELGGTGALMVQLVRR